MIDFTEDKKSATPDDLKEISTLAEKAITLKDRIATGQALLKKLDDELNVIEQEELPEKMKAVGLESFVHKSGASIAIKPIIIGSLPSKGAIQKASPEDAELLLARKEEGLEFITSNGGEAIIKSLASVDIGKDPELKEKVAKALEAVEAPFEFDETVHPQTLNSWIKEKLAANVKVPVETFSIFSSDVAKITLPKKAK